MKLDARIYVSGGRTLTGRALLARLAADGFTHVAGAGDEPDPADRTAVDRFFARERPEYVFVAAGRAGGIAANQEWPADLMLDNLLVAAHVIPAAAAHRVTKLLYVATSCTYPREAAQPLHVSSLWSGPLEPTSAAYATAKLAGMELCAAYRQQQGALFIPVIAADAYGPGDEFSPQHSHVVAALLRRMHEAREAGAPHVDVWGSGRPRREFIYVEDLADACLFAMRHYEGIAPLNLGTGVDHTIAQLADVVRQIVGYRGELRFDRARPDGMPYKALDSTALRALGWRPRWTLRQGLHRTYEWYLAHRSSA